MVLADPVIVGRSLELPHKTPSSVNAYCFETSSLSYFLSLFIIKLIHEVVIECASGNLHCPGWCLFPLASRCFLPYASLTSGCTDHTLNSTCL